MAELKIKIKILILIFLVGKTGKDLVGQQLHGLVKPLVEVKGLVLRDTPASI